MKILEMTATFGKLQKATLRPGEGFSLIQLPNEGGKSTWAAFLRAMFYGFPARDRNKEGYIAEKNRYQPWSGAAMEGSLTLEWQGRTLTLYRGPKGNTAWGAFSATWTSTGEPVPGLTAETCGETLLGVSREVFERTAFVGQGSISLTPSGDLEKRIAALATSGEEDVSYSQVERRLKDWLNRRKVNSKVGLIPDLELELSTVEYSLARQGDLLRSAQEARQTRERLETQKAALESKLQAHSAAHAAQQAEKHQQAQAEYDTALAQLQAVEKVALTLPTAEELRQAQGELAYWNTLNANSKLAEKALPDAREKAESTQRIARADSLYGNLDPTQAATKAQRDAAEVEKLSRKRLHPLLLLLLPLLFSLGLTLWAWFRPQDLYTSFPWWSPLPIALPAIWLASLLVILPLCFLRKNRQKKLNSLLSRCEAETAEDILARSAAYQEKWNTAQNARQELQNLEKECSSLTAQKDELKARLLDFVHPFAPEVSDLFGISAAISRGLQQGERYNLAKTRVEAAEKLLSAIPVPSGETPLSPSALPQGDAAQLAEELAETDRQLRLAGDTAARLEGELRSLGDRTELEARRGQLMEQLEVRRNEYDAIAIAMESLKSADSLLRERFSPAINARAGYYLSLLTGGKYDRASLTRQFRVLAQESGEAAPRQDLTLSGGAAQQLYLATRLAMCELALPQTEPCPILLDDALDSFDDTRAGLALECLCELAKTRQVLLFTCHSREKALLQQSSLPVTLVTD